MSELDPLLREVVAAQRAYLSRSLVRAKVKATLAAMQTGGRRGKRRGWIRVTAWATAAATLTLAATAALLLMLGRGHHEAREQASLSFTVGGSDAAKDLFSLYDDTIARLLAVPR